MSTKDLKLFDLLDGLEMTKSQYEWLARRFENMTAKEALLFRGAMQIEQPQATCDVMQIANQLEHYELLYGAGNDFALGNFVMEHIFYPSSQTREFLDPAKVGAAYRQKDGNTFCDGNFIRLSSPLDLFQNSDPAMLPDRGDYGIRVKLASRNNMEGIWVGFPDTSEYMDSSHPDELLLALDALEAETLTECIAVDVDCCLPQLGDILSQYDSAAELIRHAIDFGYVWAEQGQGEPRWLDKWQAVLELEDCHRLDYALDLAQNLHCYNFLPRNMELADYGKMLAKQDGIYPMDELLVSCFDAEGYANQKMRNAAAIKAILRAQYPFPDTPCPASKFLKIKLSNVNLPPPETTRNAYIPKKTVGRAFTAQNGSKKWNLSATAMFVNNINAANRDCIPNISIIEQNIC